MSEQMSTGCPVLIVHGLWDTATRVGPLADGLRARGFERVFCMSMPSFGRAPIPDLGERVRVAADQLRGEHACAQIDLIGFSMGALAARYFVQRRGGRECVRRFISISGPHRGTMTAYSLPFAGVRQMRPGSPLLRELESDPDPWGRVEVHCIYTPYDLMIVPAVSSVLPGAKSVHRMPVPVHRWMVSDPRVHELVAKLLTAGAG
jgi:triacylglycerol lipase